MAALILLKNNGLKNTGNDNQLERTIFSPSMQQYPALLELREARS